MTIEEGLGVPQVARADGQGWNLRRRVEFKRRKNRAERRRARLNPECPPAYGLYRKYML